MEENSKTDTSKKSIRMIPAPVGFPFYRFPPVTSRPLSEGRKDNPEFRAIKQPINIKAMPTAVTGPKPAE